MRIRAFSVIVVASACLGVVALGDPLVAQARSSAPVADPVPVQSRFEERWEAAPPGSAPWRSLKHLPLVSNDLAWITFGGSFRIRGSETRAFQFSPAEAMRDDYSEWRALGSADLWVGRRDAWHARGFAEWRDAQGFGRTLPGGVRPSEADRSDWQDRFVEVGYGRQGVRAGRQDVALGRERLVGIADWSNSRRTFEGVRGLASVGRLQFDAFDGRVVEVRMTTPDRADMSSHIRFATVTRSGIAAPQGQWRLAGAQAYAIDVEQQSGAADRLTAGARLWWDRRAGTTDWSAEFEGATQTGRVGARALRAWFAVTEGTVTWRQRAWSPSVTLGVDLGSGTGPDSARRSGTFAPPYATAHGFTGIADVFGRGNLLERRIGFGLRPRPPITVSLIGRRFSRMRTEDGVYSKANAVIRPASDLSARWIADEVDLTARWNIGKRVRFDGGGAWVGAGDFIKATGPATPVGWFFLSTGVMF